MMFSNKVNRVPLAATELTRILFHQYVQKALPTLAQQLWLSVKLFGVKMLIKWHFRREREENKKIKNKSHTQKHL